MNNLTEQEQPDMSEDPRWTIILSELRQINEKLDDYSTRTTTVEAKIKPLFPNGQPGLLHDYDKRLKDLEAFYLKVAGASVVVAGLASLATFAWEFVKAKLFQ